MSALPPILNLATTFAGGAGTALKRSHRAFLDAGISSRILVTTAPSQPIEEVSVCARRAASLIERLAWRVGLRLDPSDRMLRAVENARRNHPETRGYELFSPPFARYYPESHPWAAEAALVHFHWVTGLVDWPRFLSVYRKPAIFTLHDQQPYLGGVHYEDDLTTNPWLAPFERTAREVKQAALGARPVAVVGNSDWNTRAARASGFFPKTATFQTIYYALDTTLFAARPRSEARAELGLPQAGRIVGFACDDLGNHRKGFDVLAEALRSLPADVRRTTSLVSFGRAPDDELARSVALPWKHLGYLESDVAKANAYSAMDLFVVPSRAEAFGQTAIEAMACGAVVVASKIGGLIEAVDHGRGGVLVPPNDVALLRAAIEELLANDARRTALAAGARAHVVRQHNPARHANAYQEVFAQLIQSR